MPNKTDDKDAIYEAFWLFRKNKDLMFDILFKPELFAAWLTVSGKRGDFGDKIGTAREMYTNLSSMFYFDKKRLAGLIEKVQGLLEVEL